MISDRDSIERFLVDHPHLPTPFLVLDLDVVAGQYRRLTAALPGVTVLYAVKANPAPAVLRALAAHGSSFDVASPGEIELCLACGIAPSRLSYGNTIKKEADIRYAYQLGVRIFTVDSEPELDKVLRQAPGSTVYVRIVTAGAGADWPLSRKFGCPPDDAIALLRKAARGGCQVGISFHVGSQQRDPQAWNAPLEQVAATYAALAAEGHVCAGVNLGGGLPASYQDPVAPIASYGAAIRAALASHLGPSYPGQVYVEPGRYLVADAGVIVSEVVLISRRGGSAKRWVYLDIGMFNGLAETLEEAIRYRIRTPGRHGVRTPVVLAGPTCDSADVLYEKAECLLAEDLAIGDRVRLLSAGAYTASYSSVGFNGFAPLETHLVGTGDPGVLLPRQPTNDERPGVLLGAGSG
jgi:ornithine decarboxylase